MEAFNVFRQTNPHGRDTVNFYEWSSLPIRGCYKRGYYYGLPWNSPEGNSEVVKDHFKCRVRFLLPNYGSKCDFSHNKIGSTPGWTYGVFTVLSAVMSATHLKAWLSLAAMPVQSCPRSFSRDELSR